MNNSKKGFTLIEVLVVIAIIAILAAIVLVAINPAKRFQDARNSQRQANVESILSALQQNMVDNKGILTNCSGIPQLPTAAGEISKAGVDLAASGCLSSYLAVLPVDPQSGHWTDSSSYDTGYTIVQDPSTKQITIDAPSAKTDGVSSGISVTR